MPSGCAVRTFFTVIKGARSAPDVGLAVARGQAPREDDADPDAAQLLPVTRRAFPGTLRAWAPLAAHWCTIVVSVIADGLPMHPRCRWATALLA